jgi:hypothetical protein
MHASKNPVRRTLSAVVARLFAVPCPMLAISVRVNGAGGPNPGEGGVTVTAVEDGGDDGTTGISANASRSQVYRFHSRLSSEAVGCTHRREAPPDTAARRHDENDGGEHAGLLLFITAVYFTCLRF